MKIGLVLSNTPSYSETFFNSKIKKLQESGHEVTLFAKKNKDYKDAKVIAPLSVNILGVLTFVCYGLFNMLTFRAFYLLELQERQSKQRALKNTFLNAHILAQKLDWLHFGYATMALNRELVAEVIQAKMAVSFRGYDINVYPLQNKDCYKLLWRKIDKVHSISKYLLYKAYNLGLSSKIDYKIINPAIDFKKINLLKVNKQIENLKIFKIVTIARLNWIKGVQYAIDAMKYLLAENIDFEYRIIGGGTKQEVEYAKFLIHEHNLENKVFIEGKLSHLDTYQALKMADVYIQPSIGEGFCNAVLEAQAFGKLCIVTNAGGLPENIINNKTGIIIPTLSSVEIFNAIKTIINMPEEQKDKFSKFGKKNVRENYNIEKQQQEFLDFYK